MLSKPALLLAFVAKELRNGKPADGFPHRLRLRRDHARQSRSHLGAKRNLSIALVRERVELADDLVATLFRVELEWLQGRTIVFHETVPSRNITPHRHEVVAGGELLGVK